MSEKIKVFLCYAKEDIEKVEQLYNKLDKEGCEPWLDTEKLLPGDEWETAIKQAIRSSDLFVACLSRKSITKDGYLNREIKEALRIWEEKAEGKRFLIPARFEDCEVPDNLRRFHWVDVYTEKGLNKLLTVLGLQQARSKEFTEFEETYPKKVPTKEQNILIVDDNESSRTGISRILMGSKYKVATAETGEEALDIVTRNIFDMAIVDLNLPGMSGVDLLKKIKRYDSSIVVIIITAHGEVDSYLDALNSGAFEYLNKPINVDKLKKIVALALSRRGSVN